MSDQEAIKFYQQFDAEELELIKECGANILKNIEKTFKNEGASSDQLYKLLSIRWFVTNELTPDMHQ
ncbi:MAG: hypothetical protein OEY56_07200 [Cyclobacteriaceae bacterium]|nr:hypothetical protein [Cyclobacteriaceae bacterium]